VLCTDEHPSADEVWNRVRRRFPHVSRATVYNTLNLFVEKGLFRQYILTEGRMVFDSEVEKQFAKDLGNNENVRLFVKLPRWFKIDTPIGPYNPDWAFVTEREERRSKENQKIVCGKRHFEALKVDFNVVTKLSEVSM